MNSKEPAPKKSLGQHWLHDSEALAGICEGAELTKDDVVLEIGPGLGTLTEELTKRAGKVIAVEYDDDLAKELPGRVGSDNLEIVYQDILKFDFTSLEPDFKVVANIPYYLTSNLIRVMSETPNRPCIAVLLVQKEVAQRITAAPGNLSILGVTAQYYWHVTVGFEVPASMFTPPPKVDSQVLSLQRRDEPPFGDIDTKKFFRLVKAGFGERRKKLRSSLSHGLGMKTDEIEKILNKASIDPNLRAQALSLDDWYRIYENI